MVLSPCSMSRLLLPGGLERDTGRAVSDEAVEILRLASEAFDAAIVRASRACWRRTSSGIRSADCF
jgi:hypothetical protein